MFQMFFFKAETNPLSINDLLMKCCGCVCVATWYRSRILAG